MRLVALFPGLLLLNLLAGEALAQATGSVAVSVTIPGRCQLETIAGLSFGNVNVPLAADTDANGSVRVRCNLNTFVSLTLGPGQHHDGVTRRMGRSSGATSYFLEYELYTDAARTILWGTDTKNVPRNPGRTWAVFGRIPAGAGTLAGPGMHVDQVIVTAAW